jgi:putative ABC transport system substrate-binding protein
MMDRRRALTLLLAMAAPLASSGQPPQGKIRLISLLISEPLAGQASRIAALHAGLRDRGYVEGRNLAIAIRSAEGNYDRLPALAFELAGLEIDVLVAFGTKALSAASSATRTVPTVIPATSNDPISMGLVKSLAHPGGNLTGSTTFGSEVMVERLELVREILPGATRVALLLNPANSSTGTMLSQMNAAAGSWRRPQSSASGSRHRSCCAQTR